MFGILYKCNDGRDYYCTSSRFAHFSEDIESIAEFAQQKTAEKLQTILPKQMILKNYMVLVNC
ncbi:hypothetical protein [Klebsiella phage phiKp_21]|nr:hypothetical protein [Klebsiella phage phiKp_21]